MQYRSLTRATAPAVEPVTLSEAKAHLRVDSEADDSYIASLIAAAREWVETYLDRTLVNTQWTMRLDRFPPNSLDPIELPRPPMVTSGAETAVSVAYTLENGTAETLSTATYRVHRHETPGKVATIYGGTWPAGREDDNAVTVTWWAGYGNSGASVPATIRHAMLMLVGQWYERRMAADSMGGGEIPFGVSSLLDSQRWGSYR